LKLDNNSQNKEFSLEITCFCAYPKLLKIKQRNYRRK